MCVWAEGKQLNPNELKIKLLLSTDNYGYTAWHRAATKSSLEALQRVWSWAKEGELITDELLLAQTGEGYTAFQLETRNNHVETQKLMWVWAEERQLNTNELTKNLF